MSFYAVAKGYNVGIFTRGMIANLKLLVIKGNT